MHIHIEFWTKKDTQQFLHQSSSCIHIEYTGAQERSTNGPHTHSQCTVHRNDPQSQCTGTQEVNPRTPHQCTGAQDRSTLGPPRVNVQVHRSQPLDQSHETYGKVHHLVTNSHMKTMSKIHTQNIVYSV